MRSQNLKLLLAFTLGVVAIASSISLIPAAGGHGGQDPESEYNIELKWTPNPLKPGEEVKFDVIVTDRSTGQPVTGTTVPVGVQFGEMSMGMMSSGMTGRTRMNGMMSGMMRGTMNDGMGGGMGCTMIYAVEGSPGVYSFRYTFDESGNYTVHVHVIPPGGSMMNMMENHKDFPLTVG